eukprot:5227197-Pyramimonas_sp.AAC.1
MPLRHFNVTEVCPPACFHQAAEAEGQIHKLTKEKKRLKKDLFQPYYPQEPVSLEDYSQYPEPPRYPPPGSPGLKELTAPPPKSPMMLTDQTSAEKYAHRFRDARYD